MWKRKVGSDFFEKDLQTEGFDSNSVLIVGGETDSVSYASETFFTNKDCQVENLPSSNAGHSLLLSAGDHKVLSCGGYHDNYKKNCLEWDTQNSQQNLSRKVQERHHHTENFFLISEPHFRTSCLNLFPVM